MTTYMTAKNQKGQRGVHAIKEGKANAICGRKVEVLVTVESLQLTDDQLLNETKPCVNCKRLNEDAMEGYFEMREEAWDKTHPDE